MDSASHLKWGGGTSPFVRFLVQQVTIGKGVTLDPEEGGDLPILNQDMGAAALAFVVQIPLLLMILREVTPVNVAGFDLPGEITR